MTVSKHWCNLEKDDTTEHEDQMNLVFANHGKEEEIPSYNNRDSRSTEKGSKIKDLSQK